MRKTVASFLIAFMVAMPVLACCCPQDVQVSSHNDAHAGHQHHNDGSTSDHSKHDCSKADLQVANQIVSAQPSDLQNKIHFEQIPPNNASMWILALTSHIVHDTPLLADSPHTPLPVFLTTQRLRI